MGQEQTFVPEINCGIGFADVGISIDETWISIDFLNDSSILILIVTVIFVSYAPGRAPLSLSTASQRLQVDHRSLCNAKTNKDDENICVERGSMFFLPLL